MHTVTSILRRALLQHIPVAIDGAGTLRTVRSGAQFATGRRLDPPRRMPELIPAGEAMTDDEEGYTEGVPLLEIVAAELTADAATAAMWEEEWRGTVCAAAAEAGWGEGAMLLEGIGTIAFREEADYNGYIRQTAEFYPDPEFLELLNPLPTEPLVLPLARGIPGTGGTTGSTGVSEERRRRHRRRAPMAVAPRGRNPHQYTVSFLAVLIALGALAYVCYYVWAYTEWLSDWLPR